MQLVGIMFIASLYRQSEETSVIRTLNPASKEGCHTIGGSLQALLMCRLFTVEQLYYKYQVNWETSHELFEGS